MKIFTRQFSAKQQVSIYFAGTLVRQVTGFIMLPIYTSHLAPADYGIIGLLMALLAVLETLFGARFAFSLPKFYYEVDESSYRHRLISTALLSSIAVSLTFYLLISPFSTQLSTILLGTENNAKLIQIYLLALVTTGVEAYGLAYLRIKQQPILFILASILKLIIQLSLNIYLIVFKNLGAYGIVIASVTSSALFALVYSVFILRVVSFHFDKRLFMKLIRYCWPLWLAGLGTLYVSSTSRVFIRYFSSLEDLGLFELAAKFAGVLTMLLWEPFSQWWQVERFRLYNLPDHGIKSFNLVFNKIAFALILAAMAISIGYKPLISIMATEEYLGSNVAILPLCIAMAVYPLSHFFNFSFLAKDQTKHITVVQYLTAGFSTFFLITLIPAIGLLGAAYGILATNIASITVSFFWSKKYFDSKINPLNAIYFCAAAFITVTLANMITASIASIYLEILIRVIVLLIGSGIGLFIFRKHISLNEIFSLVRGFILRKKLSSDSKGA